jgi:PAS domain S-box-containing protein
MQSVRKRKVPSKEIRDLTDILDSHSIVTITDVQGRITYVNGRFCAVSKYTREELLGQDHRITSSGHHPKDFIRELWATISQGKVWRGEIKNRAKDGSYYWVDTVIVPTVNADGKPRGYVAIRSDVTALKDREQEIARLSRLYAALSHVNQAIVWGAPTREELFRRICRILVEQGGFHLSWIGWHDPETHLLVPVAEWGDADSYLRSVKIYADERPQGRGPAGVAFREGRPYICNDMLNDPTLLPWRAEVKQHGFRSSAVFPIRANGQAAGTLTVYADELGFFRDREIALLEEAAGNVSFALDNFGREAARRQAEQTVRQERDFSDAVLNSLPGIFYLQDRRGKFLRWNRNFERVSGYSAAEIPAMHPLDFVAAADRELIAARMAEVFEKGESHAEAGFAAKDGRVTPYYFTGIMAEVDGQNCLVGVGIDITARKRAEAERRMSEARYLTLFDYAPDGIVIADAKSYYVEANASVCRMLGYTRDELVGLHASDIVAETELAHIGPALEMIKAGLDYRREWQLRRKDGSVFAAEVMATVMPEGHLLGMIRDVTARKGMEMETQLSKQRLILATDAAAIGIWDWDIASNQWYATDTYSTMLGYDPEKVFSGGGFWLNLLHPDDRAAVAEKIRLAVAGSIAPYEYEARIRHADGSYHWISVIGRVLAVDESGKARRLLGVRMDVTERKKAEMELRATERQLHALVDRMNVVREEEAKRIARELHDDLGQQLTALNMELADLEAKLTGVKPEQQQQFARMRAGVDHTIEVVQKISGELRLGQLDVLGLTAAIEWQAREFSRSSGIACRIARLDEVTNLTDAQNTALFRILQEALTNIVRHAGATGVEVGLEAGPDYVRLQVRDNGRGITAEELKDQRAIGLLGMRERAQLVGGEVTITGGEGTTVSVTLPRNRTGALPG